MGAMGIGQQLLCKQRELQKRYSLINNRGGVAAALI
jgi:hypothetical protein